MRKIYAPIAGGLGIFAMLLASLSLAGCGQMLSALASVSGAPAAPRALADRTTLDEDTGRLLTVAYTAAARAAALSIRAGVISDAATIRRIGQLDMCAYALVQGVRIAYNSGNSTSYLTALRDARVAIQTLLSAAQGIAHAASQDQSEHAPQCSAGGGAGDSGGS